MPSNIFTGQKYIPGLGKDFFIDGTELNLVPITGSGTATAVGAGATVNVTINHQALNLNTVPDAPTTTTTNATVVIDPAQITKSSFVIKVTNSGASAQNVAYSYSRTGL